MTPPLRDYELGERIHQSARSTIHRGAQRRDGRPVVLKMVGEHPARSRISALRHEYAVLESLDVEGVITPLGLEQEGDRLFLVLDDFGGSSVRDLGLAGTASVKEVLELAITVSEILGRIHERHVVHKDINPSNILVEPRSGRVELIDFDIATVLRQEATRFGHPFGLEGTLAYVSPEQTGRMNRPLDYRSDYYSLGVTLFELFTGHLPFEHQDPLELVHAHIARPPAFPRELDPMLAAVVGRSMAKNAEERYQSARGLRADLCRCLDRLGDDGRIEPFDPGTDDRSGRFVFPLRLRGREDETHRLLDALEQSRSGAVLALVSGPPGIGKSALIRELHRPLTASRGYYAAGSFDQYVEATPYSALRSALEMLVQQVVTEDERELTRWRTTITEALGGDISTLHELCPSFELVLGPRTDEPSPTALEARGRVERAVRELVGLFATEEHPLCLVLDDLQWADADSLELLQTLMGSARARPLLLVGSYRDDEVDERHPLMVTLRQMEGTGARIEPIALAHLREADVTEFVAETLSVPNERATELGALVHQRTAGNPYFMRTFLAALRSDEALRLRDGEWQWDPDQVHQRGTTDNVVELLLRRMERLPDATRRVLQEAACVGGRFELATLTTVAARPLEEVAAELWPAIEAELVLVLGRVHSLVEMQGSSQLGLAFAHDRIRQAVVSTLGDEATSVHARIGQRMLAALPPEQLQEHLFDVVVHLGRGRERLEPAEIEHLGALSLRAARKALWVSAARLARSFARTGLATLREDDWEQRRSLALGLHVAGAESAFLDGDLEEQAELSRLALARVRTQAEELPLRELEGQVHFSQQRLPEAMTTYLETLATLGVELRREPTAEDVAQERRWTSEALAEHPVESLLELPRCTDPHALASLRLLNALLEISWIAGQNLKTIAECRIIRISIEHGNGPRSAFAYASHGVLVGKSGDIEAASRFGRLAITLAERFGERRFLAQIYLYASCHLVHWNESLADDTIPRLLEGYRYGVEAGNPQNASANAMTYCLCRLLAGAPLDEVVADMERFGAYMTEVRQDMIKSWMSIYLQLALNLRGESEDPVMLVGEAYDETDRVPAQREANDNGGMFNYGYGKTLLCYLFGEFARAVEVADETRAFFSKVADTSFSAAPWTLLDSLARLALVERVEEDRRPPLLDAVASNLESLATWAEHSPHDVEHRRLLVEAERARVLAQSGKAVPLFERAIERARLSGFVQDEAIACELLARLLLEQGSSSRGRSRLRDAHDAYLRWGAFAKSTQLEQTHPYLLPSMAASLLDTTTLTVSQTERLGVNVLDLVGVIEASQAISSELDIERLLARLMELLIETSGAERGCLLKERDGRWSVEVERDADRPATSRESVLVSELGGKGRRELPLSVVRYVSRTHETVSLDDPHHRDRFGPDPYLRARGVQSMLCFPLGRQGSEPWVVYLDNTLVKGVFTAGRVQILQMLSAQAVTSLENAALYDTLEARVETRTRELEHKNQELLDTLARLRETQDRLIVQDRLASLGSMVAGIAHEIRNPLNFVNNFAELSAELVGDLSEVVVKDGGPTPDDLEEVEELVTDLEGNLQRIARHGKRMDAIVQSMLQHSRGGTGSLVPTDVNALVDSHAEIGIQSCRTRWPDLELTLERDLDPELGELRVVPQDLSRVIMNVVDNAGHAVATRARELDGAGYAPRVRVRTVATPSEVEIRIYDNGTGIPQEVLDQVFAPFFTTKRTGEGTGLGLSISHDIVVKSLGGSIEIETEPGVFTEIVIRLPRAPPVAVDRSNE